MSSHKRKKSLRLKKAVSIVVMGTICLTAAASVAALAQTFEVKDAVIVGNVSDNDPGNNKKETIVPIKSVALEKKNGDNVLTAFETNTTKESKVEMELKKNETPALADKSDEEPADVSNDIVWCSVKINLRGKDLYKKVPLGTVSDVLAYLKIELTDKDSLNVDLDKEIKNNENIVVTRTVVGTSVIEKEIGFKTVNKDSETLFEGDTKVETEGEKGVQKITIEKTYINGKLASQKEIDKEIVKEPVDKVVLKGTAEKVDHFATAQNGAEVKANEDGKTFTDANGVEREYVDVLTGSGTAYYAEPGAGTATGRLAQYGVVAVNPNIIPYGSKLYIVSNDGEVIYGDAVAGDTGGGLMDNLILVDLFYPTYDECCVFGRRDVTIYILEYGNEFR